MMTRNRFGALAGFLLAATGLAVAAAQQKPARTTAGAQAGNAVSVYKSPT